LSTKIQVRRDLAANWTTANPTLLRGEIGYEYDTVKVKIGNGISDWASLPYAIVSQTMVEDLIADHADRTDNPHSVTKAQIGLGDVPNVDATLRSNHTGTQAVSTISDFETATDARIDLQKGVSLGLATLDTGGKVPVSQLPSTLMEYLGTWNATTNTPTLANGTPANTADDAGSVYLCSVAGTVNFGAGPITFTAGDWVILSSSLVWEKSINSNLVSSVNGYQGIVSLTKSDIGLSNVDNISAANLRDRSTHTGTQLASTISDFTAVVLDITTQNLEGGSPFTVYTLEQNISGGTP